LLGIVAPALPPELAGECREREQIVTCIVEVRSGIGQLVLKGRNDPVELRGDRCCVGLVEDRPHERRHSRLGGLRDLLQEVGNLFEGSRGGCAGWWVLEKSSVRELLSERYSLHHDHGHELASEAFIARVVLHVGERPYSFADRRSVAPVDRIWASLRD
jgi:hypothetical protein